MRHNDNNSKPFSTYCQLSTKLLLCSLYFLFVCLFGYDSVVVMSHNLITDMIDELGILNGK